MCQTNVRCNVNSEFSKRTKQPPLDQPPLPFRGQQKEGHGFTITHSDTLPPGDPTGCHSLNILIDPRVPLESKVASHVWWEKGKRGGVGMGAPGRDVNRPTICWGEKVGINKQGAKTIAVCMSTKRVTFLREYYTHNSLGAVPFT